ncbi:MAG: CRISPR-associated RAMP protein, partial [Myxococcales bacterium]|nr:CRISPR-associated RAMP protein [Myxococcales bacterium]
ESRLRLRGLLVTATALHIGAAKGDDQGNSDMPVLRDGRGHPFIPGASLKGVLRATIEGLINGTGDRSGKLSACDPLAKGCGQHDEGRRSAVDLHEHCTVCRMLGSHVLASHVRIGDALLRHDHDDGARVIEMRDGVAIDRDLGRVYKSNKYDFEVVAPGVGFDLEVFVENPEPWLMGLLMLGWDQLAAGYTALGGFSSRGLGRVELHWEEGQQWRAADLLAGREPSRWQGAALLQEQDRWRQALVQYLEGDDVRE